MTARWTPSVCLPAEIVGVLNVIVGRRRNLHFELKGRDHHFRWRVGDLPFTPKMTCICRWSGGDIRLTLGDLPSLGALDETLDALEWSGLEDGLRSLVFESFLQSALTSMGVVLPGQISIESLSLSGELPPPSADIYVLPFAITGPFANLTGSLGLPLKSIRRLVKLGSGPAPRNAPFVDALPFPFTVEIGRTQCDLPTLSQLRLNDVVLIDNDVPLKEGRVVLRCHTFYFDAVFDHTQLTLGELMENENDDQLPVGTVPESVEERSAEENPEESPEGETTRGEELPPETDEASEDRAETVEEEVVESAEAFDGEVPDDLDLEEPHLSAGSPTERLPVNLSFDLGTKVFSLAEISSFGPGYTFDLGRGLESPVDIRANGLKIASGELVTINDRLGVRVLSLYDRR
jgi:type III secretion system YscQ/HrcQ family protein